MTAIAMALLGYFAQRTMSEFDTIRSRQVVNEQRITILEADSKALHENLLEMKITHKEMLMELRNITIAIAKSKQ